MLTTSLWANLQRLPCVTYGECNLSEKLLSGEWGLCMVREDLTCIWLILLCRSCLILTVGTTLQANRRRSTDQLARRTSKPLASAAAACRRLLLLRDGSGPIRGAGRRGRLACSWRICWSAWNPRMRRAWPARRCRASKPPACGLSPASGRPSADRQPLPLCDRGLRTRASLAFHGGGSITVWHMLYGDASGPM